MSSSDDPAATADRSAGSTWVPNERGLPKAWLERTIAQLPVEVLANEAWGFPLIPRGGHKLGLEVPYSHRSLALMDVVLSRVLAFNATYHRRTRLAKLSPAAFFLVARRTQ